jgi:isoquinoline 1-oxidoreductase subunit beta
MTITRRSFLKTGALAASGLVIAVELPSSASADAPASSVTVFAPNAYIAITPDNVIRLWVTRSEMGQGVRTTLPMMLAEELEADWTQIQLTQAVTSPQFKGIRLRTSGSGSTVGTYATLRKAGATAREMLIAAAAQTWQVEPSTCRATRGTVVHVPSGRRLTYGELAISAARQQVPGDPPLKNPKDFQFIGKPRNRTDSAAIVEGLAIYGIDTYVPGMLYAVMERCPVLGGKIQSFDASKSLAVPGVRAVVPIKSGLSLGVAIVADNTWTAMKGREALRVEWDPGPHRNFDSAKFIGEMRAAVVQDGYFVRSDGNSPAAIASAATKVEATYEFPYQAHAPLETMNCVADVRRDSCEIWVPSQCPREAQKEAAEMLGISPDAVTVHVTLIGGGFGRRLFSDYVHETVELSRAIGKPVQLLWTRSDDMRFGYFQPPSVERIVGGFNANGKPVAWLQKSVGCDLTMFPLSEVDRKNVRYYYENEEPWGAFDNPYNFSHLQADFIPMDAPVPTGPWRAVMYPARVFARESFLDEMALAAGEDPVAFRLRLLAPGDVLKVGSQKIDRSRLIKVLQVAAEKSDWKKPLQHSGDRVWGRGIACNVYAEDCFIAQVAEVSVGKQSSDIKVHRMVCAIDCGLVINPRGLDGQAESGITWGLSATLHGGIEFKNGGALQTGYTDFTVIGIDEAPAIETLIIPSDHPPGGFGETAVPPVAPAVANAIFAATGKRMRQLPITAEKLSNA